jgi:hypothetical protein
VAVLLLGSMGTPKLQEQVLPTLPTHLGTAHRPRGIHTSGEQTQNYLSWILPLQGVVFSALAWELKKEKSTKPGYNQA